MIHARDGSEDKIACGTGEDTVYADFKDDVAADCEHVLRKPAADETSS